MTKLETNSEHTAQIWQDFHLAVRRFVSARIQNPTDVDDVVQEIFLKIHNKSADLQDGERVAGWVFRIASNTVNDHFRNLKRKPPTPDHVSDAPLSDAEEALAACVLPFVDMLDTPYRDALKLTELQGLTQAQAAVLEGVSLSGMKSRVQRGRKLLRSELEACCGVTLDGRGHIMEFHPNEPMTPCGCSSCPTDSIALGPEKS